MAEGKRPLPLDASPGPTPPTPSTSCDHPPVVSFEGNAGMRRGVLARGTPFHFTRKEPHMAPPNLRRPPVTPMMNEGANVSVQTAAVGTNWATFAAHEIAQLTIVNDTGTTIEWRQDAGAVSLPVADGASFSIFGVDDASRISVRRLDQSNTQVTVKARWER